MPLNSYSNIRSGSKYSESIIKQFCQIKQETITPLPCGEWKFEDFCLLQKQQLCHTKWDLSED
jgi:hypothetical protein